MPLKLGHAMMIHNFLNGNQRRSASVAIAEILVKHLHFISKDLDAAKGRQRMINEYAAALCMLEHDLEAAMREQLMESLARLEKIFPRHSSMLSTVSALLEKVAPTTASLDSGDFASLVMRRGGVKWWSNHWWGEVSGSFEPKFADEAVEEFIDSILGGKYRRDYLVSVETDVIYAGVRANQLMNVLKFRRYEIAREPEQSARDYLNVSLVRARVLPASHLPENLAEIFHAEPRLHEDYWDLPDPEYWGRLLASPAEAQAVLDKFDVRNDYVLRGMMEYLLNHPPEANVRQVIIRHYETRLTSNQRWQRITAARVLLRLSHWREPREKADLRERLDSFFKDTKPSLSEWAHAMMIPMEPQHDYPRGYAILEDQCRSEWIEWSDDDLSARFSWSSQIHHELAPLPHNWKLKPDNGLFMYLNSYLDACDACPWTGVRYEPKKLNEAVSAVDRRGPVPAPPFTATPWQRARELHLHRPDLELPERALYRPHFHNRE